MGHSIDRTFYGKDFSQIDRACFSWTDNFTMYRAQNTKIQQNKKYYERCNLIKARSKGGGGGYPCTPRRQARSGGASSPVPPTLVPPLEPEAGSILLNSKLTFIFRIFTFLINRQCHNAHIKQSIFCGRPQKCATKIHTLQITLFNKLRQLLSLFKFIINIELNARYWINIELNARYWINIELNARCWIRILRRSIINPKLEA